MFNVPAIYFLISALVRLSRATLWWK